MADRYTAVGDVWTPERIGEVIVDTIYEELALFNTPAVTSLNATFSNGGNTVTFPVFNGVQGDFEDLDPEDTTGVQPDTTYSEMDFETVDVVSKILDVGIKGCTLDDAFKAGQFEIVDATLDDVAAKAENMIDKYLVTLANATSLSYTIPTSGTMNRTGVIKAKVTKWGDMSRLPAVFVCHSKVFGDIQDEVKDVYNAALNVGVNQGGTVQLYHGMPVYVSDNCPVAGSDYTSFVLGPGAIGFDFHRRLSYAVIRERGDKYVHEFVARYFGKLRRRKTRPLAIKIISK
jgi:hypothetical protein